MCQLEDEELDARKERALLLLLEGKTISEAAAELGVDRSTVYRWRKGDALFIAELNRLKRSVWEAGESKLITARTAAIEAAMALLEDEDARVRLKAIDIILRMELRGINGPTSLEGARYQVSINGP